MTSLKGLSAKIRGPFFDLASSKYFYFELMPNGFIVSMF